MRRLLKFCLVVVGVLISIPLIGIGWLYFDPSGLPDVESVARFAPNVETQASDACLRTVAPTIVAIPYDAIGSNLLKALSVTEAGENDPGLVEAYYLGLRTDARSGKFPRAGLSWQISRTMFCKASPSRTVNHQLDTLRLAAQLERHYSHRELFTIFVNRLYLGEGQYGVRGAALHYFEKEPSQLSIEEAALLAGIPKAPTLYSPRLHPDLVLERRNQVIDMMATAHTISESEAAAAKAAPVLIAAKPNT